MNVRDKRRERAYEVQNGVTDQPSPKKRRIAVGERPSGLVRKSAHDFEIQRFCQLWKIAKLDLTFCEANINEAVKFVQVCAPVESSQTLADIEFMKKLEDQFINLISLLVNFKQKGIEKMSGSWFESTKEKISNLCYCLILIINNECVAIKRALNTVDALNALNSGTKGSLNKLFIRNAQDPLKKQYCGRARANLTILKNFQKMYYSYVLPDVAKCLELAKIALFWNEEELALEFYKNAIVSLKREEIENSEDILKNILQVLREYWIKNPFKQGSCKELVDFHIDLKKDNLKKSTLTRSFSCHNGFGFQFSGGEN